MAAADGLSRDGPGEVASSSGPTTSSGSSRRVGRSRSAAVRLTSAIVAAPCDSGANPARPAGTGRSPRRFEHDQRDLALRGRLVLVVGGPDLGGTGPPRALLVTGGLVGHEVTQVG